MFRIASLTVFCALSFACASFALEPKPVTTTFGLEIEHQSAKNEDLKSDGFLYGGNAAFTYRGWVIDRNRFPTAMARLEGRIVFGRVKVEGEVLDGNEYEFKNIRDFIGETRALAGYDYTIFTDTVVTPYLGLGYRFYKNDLSKYNAGYRRVSHYFYLPIGFETRTPLSDGWSWGAGLEYDLFLTGRQDTYYSDLDALFSDLEQDLSSGYGFRGSLKFRKELEDKNYLFEPYVNIWNIGKSKAADLNYNGAFAYRLTEPRNKTREIGVKVAVEF